MRVGTPLEVFVTRFLLFMSLSLLFITLSLLFMSLSLLLVINADDADKGSFKVKDASPLSIRAATSKNMLLRERCRATQCSRPSRGL